MRDADDFTQELISTRGKPEPGYGGMVFPAARVLSSVANEAELAAFKEALERLLASPDLGVQQWAANICVGFQHFRDAIPAPAMHRPSGRTDGAVAPQHPEAGLRDVRYFFDALSAYAVGRGDVGDAFQLYKQARAGDEALAFLDALEQLLISTEEAVRKFGIEICVESVLSKPSFPKGAPEGPTEFVVHSREPFRLNRNVKLRARKLVGIHLPRAILSPEGTPLSDIVVLSNKDATIGLLEAKPGGGVAAIVFELAPGDEILLTRSSEAIVEDGTDGGIIVFDALAT